MEIDKEEFIKIGNILYGDIWQSQFAKELGISLRSVQYWVSGGRSITSEMQGKIIEIAYSKVGRMRGFLIELETK